MNNKPNNEEVNILVDLVYNGTMNQFEEFYGETVSYHELEQKSYIELKSMLSHQIGRIKFRKARDIILPHGLTCKMEMSKPQYDKFMDIYCGKAKCRKNNMFSFLYDFKLMNVRMDAEPNG